MARVHEIVHGSLFSGIGGFDLAASWCGWKNAFHCEIDLFCQRILQHYWPQAALIENIIGYDWKKWKGKINVLSGGFPCQPFSLAGKRRGTNDGRHLWPAMLGAIREIKPQWVVGENVRGIVSWNEGMVFEQVHTDLEAAGYQVQSFILPAAGVGAPHRRERVFFIAHTPGKGWTKEAQRRWEEYFRQRWPLWNYPSPIGESGIAPYPNGHRRHGTGKKTAPENRWQQGPGQPGQLEGRSAGLCIPGIVTNPKGEPGNDIKPGRQSKTGIKEQKEPGGGAGKDAPSHADGHQRSERWRHQEGPQTADGNACKPGACNRGNTWQDFPSVPPVCGGDDGISSMLDVISFPRWRNQSLQALGNAVVPEVVFQIFTCIQELTDFENCYGR